MSAVGICLLQRYDKIWKLYLKRERLFILFLKMNFKDELVEGGFV